MESRRLLIPEGLDGLRVDQGLAKLTGLSRSQIADIIDRDEVLRDDLPQAKSAKLVAGTYIDIVLPSSPEPLTPQAQVVAGMEILHVDHDIVVLDKPVGVAAHPTVGWEGPTVLGGLAAAGISVALGGPPERRGIVHRLDVGTSGVMVVARSERAYSQLKHAFKERAVEKTYHAVVQGYPDPFTGTIDAPISRHPSKGYKFAVTRDGRRAVTHYTTLEAFRQATLLSIHLETGRTHQIRVHFSSIGHPCVGDPMYGADPKLAQRLGLTRQWLHAVSLSFLHPNGSTVCYESGYPADLQQALDMLREDTR
ncbi:MAG: RluA family pseudouridine synthase [Corynebacterium sp.]|nr:RluA family pseudouridine synthase [Corynebacterium sp.]